MKTTGIRALLHMLSQAGVEYIFGNPGTTELPLNDALIDYPGIQYVLGLQETSVMAMADGFSMASGKLGVVNLHISPGLGNAMGILYNAFREGTPLLVTVGQQDRRLHFSEPILGSDLTAVAKPWTKYAIEVANAWDLPHAIRRAVQAALTPPRGPVLLSLPVDLQMEQADYDVFSATPLNTELRPPLDALEAACEALLAAENPAILAGSRVTEAGAESLLVRLAEQIGAPVFSECGSTHGRLPFPCDHPLYAQGIPLWAPEVHDRLSTFDTLFVCGTDLLRLYVYFDPPLAIPRTCKIIHLDEDPYQLGKNFPTAIPILGSTKAGLEELTKLLDGRQNSAHHQAVAKRRNGCEQQHSSTRETLWRQAKREQASSPMSPLGLMSALAEVLPGDVAVIEEAVTTTNGSFERLGALKNTSGLFGHRGWGLGWGLGCAIGVQLAWPNRPVLAMLGDGAALYGIQGLWSAAKLKTPVTFVVCNNAQYQILKIGAKGLGLEKAAAGRFLGLDLADPSVDFVKLAESFGVEAVRVDNCNALAEIAGKNLRERKGPLLIEAAVDRTVQQKLNYG